MSRSGLYLWHAVILHSGVVEHARVELGVWRTVLRRHGALIIALNTTVELLRTYRRILRPRSPSRHLLRGKECGIFRSLVETLVVISPLLRWFAPFALARPIFG
jgi:hypothetical protein